MPTLVIDSGNTRVKAALFNGNSLLQTFVFNSNSALTDIQELILVNSPSAILLSDVGSNLENEMRSKIFSVPITYLSAQQNLPYINLYDSKQTLGADRKALVAGALVLYPNENCLVIDAGTCVTYDMLNSSQEYLGGNISPGLHMRLTAMHTFTGKLPNPEWQRPVDFMGTNTDSCLLTGAFYGLVGEIEYFIEKYTQKFPNLKVLLTGGNAEVLAKSIKTSIFVHEHLLLYGLNKILTHHAE